MWFVRIAVLVLVLAVSGAANARTSKQVIPTSIAFWDRDHGIAAALIYGPNDRSEGYIATTSDGGRTWAIRWRGTAVEDVGIIRGSRDAWAQINPSPSCTDCRSVLLRTRDRGRTWRRMGTTPSSPSFPTRRIGFAMNSRQTNAGDLMKTTDGGRTWRRAGAPCRKGWGGFAWKAALSFVSPSRGWVLCKGQPGVGQQSKALYVTTTGGVRWKLLANVAFEPGRKRLGGLQGNGYPGGINLSPSGAGLIWSERGFTFRTRDAGRTWHPLSATVPETREGRSGWFVNDRLAYLLLQDYAKRRRWWLLRTEDGGRTWRRVHFWPLR